MYHTHLEDFEALLLGVALMIIVALVVIGCISKGSL